MSGLFPKSKEPAPPSPLEQTAAEVESGAYSGKQDMAEKLETILKTAKTSSEIQQMVKDFLKEGDTPEDAYMSSLIINLIDSLSKTRTEKELFEDIRSVLRTTQTEVRKLFPKGGRRRIQKGGVKRVTGILQYAYYRDDHKIDTEALLNPIGQDLYRKLHDDVYYDILDHAEKAGFKSAYMLAMDIGVLDMYPLLEAGLYRYSGDDENPKLPKDLVVKVPKHGEITVKFEQFIPLRTEEVGPGVGAAAGPAAAWPVGAGAGPAPVADYNEELDSDKESESPPAAAPSKEEQDAARYKEDVKMTGGRKKTKKHKSNAKKRNTRRR